MTEARFTIADFGRDIGILDTKKNEIAVFHGYEDPLELKRRLEYAEAGLNDGSITTRDWVWEKYDPRPNLGTVTEGDQQ
jgi:hypothetical protein